MANLKTSELTSDTAPARTAIVALVKSPFGATDDRKSLLSDLLKIPLTILTADPGSPDNDTWWMVRTGTSPTMEVELKVRISGVTYTIAGRTL